MEEMVRFGLQCAATERYDTMAPLFLIDVLIDVCADMEDFDAVWEQPGIYPTVKRVLSGCIADPAHAGRVDRLRTQWAVAAWKAGEYEDAAEQLREMDRLNQDALADLNVYDSELMGDVFARVGEAAATVRRADRAVRRGDWAEAVSLLEGVPVKQRSSVSDRLATARFMALFETGEWTALPLNRSRDGWRFDSGRWSFERGGQVVATETGGNMRAILGAPVGRRFEMEVVVDATGAENPEWSSGGILFMYSGRTQSPQYWTLRSSPDQERSVAMGRRLYNTCKPKLVATTGKDRLRLVLWDEWAQGSVNGEVVFQGKLPLRDSDHRADRIGLCSRRTLDGNSLAFTELRVCKLEAPPIEMLEQEWAEQDAEMNLGAGEEQLDEGQEDGEAGDEEGGSP